MRWYWNIWLLWLLVGCAVKPTPIPTGISPSAESPSESVNLFSCQDVDQNWGQDWFVVIEALQQIHGRGEACGAEPITSKLYAAHYSYAVQLEQNGEQAQSVTHFQAAYVLDPQRQEALSALVRLQALPEPTPPSCPADAKSPSDPAQGEPPRAELVTVEGDQLFWRGEPFFVRGVNYYPRHATWHRFLVEADVSEMTAELDVISQAGFNTLRIFLWYDALFICEPERAIPHEEHFAKLDTLFALARERNLKLIVTLHDLPDLIFRPLYTDWDRYDAQTRYIVRRYRHEPHILAWDLRNEGDLDYGARGDNALFTQEEVLAWLAHSSELVREEDGYHLLTAGWWGDPAVTEPYVDVLSFHHWYDVENLQERLALYQTQTSKPLLLQEVGYHSWAEASIDARDEATQAELLRQMVTMAETEHTAGWLIWTAFDFVPEEGQPVTYEHKFGLWRIDLSEKPALTAVATR